MIAKLGKVYLDLKRVIAVLPFDIDDDPEYRYYEVILSGFDEFFTIYEKQKEDINEPHMEYDVFIDMWRATIET